MRYLKKFESFNENKQEPLELAAEILAMVGKKVTPEEVESKIEAAVKDGESQSEGEEGEKVQVQNESVGDFLNWWTDIMSQQQWNPGTLDYNMTVSAFGAWLATIATGAVSTALAATGIYKVGKAIKGLFKGKEVDYTEFVKEWCKKNNVDLSKVDLNTEEGKQIMARMYKDFEAAGGKI